METPERSATLAPERGESGAPNALFTAYPELSETLPVFPLTRLPTPVQRFKELGSALGLRRLWIKRDDVSGAAYGGNKPRKLEFIIGEARRAGARRILTFGGLGTNHGLATCLACRAAGIHLTLVLVHQPVTERVRLALRRFAALGAELVYGGKLARTAALTLGALVRYYVKEGTRPMIVPAGGSNPLGTLGQIAAALELATQVKKGLIPCPEAVFAAAGSGGTVAGLAAGMKLAGLPTRVIGILVNDIMPPSSESMTRLGNRAITLLREKCRRIPAVRITPADVRLIETELGPGYGVPTAAGGEMIDLAGRLGPIALDPVYTGKAFAGMVTEARARRISDKPLLFWLTYSSVDPAEAIGPLPSVSELPPVFRSFFAD